MADRIVAYEGFFPQDAVVMRAAAAVEHDDQIVNATTGRPVLPDTVSGLVADGHLTKLSSPVSLDKYRQGLVLFMVRRGGEFFDYFQVDTGAWPLVGHQLHGDVFYYVFPDEAGFGRYTASLFNEVVHDVLASSDPYHLAELVRWCVALDPDHGAIQAVRAYLAKDRDYVAKMVRRSLRLDQLAAFDALFATLIAEKEDYVWKYQGGAADGGGFDCNVAASVLQNVVSAHATIGAYLHRRYPFLPKTIPTPRFSSMLAASAEMHFSTSVDGRSLLDRVARHLELQFIENVLNGEAMPEWTPTPEFERAMLAVLHPTDDTQLLHGRSAGMWERAIFSPLEIPSDRDVFEELRVFCVQSGVVNNAGKIEVQLFPGFSLVLRVLQTTPGAEYLQNDHDFIRKPLGIVLRRRFRDSQDLFELQEVALIERGLRFDVDAIPSSFLTRGFVRVPPISLSRRTDDAIQSRIGDIVGVSGRSKAEAATWLRGYADLCAAHELEQARNGQLTLLPPRKPRKRTFLERVVVSLLDLGEAASVADLVAKMGEKYGVNARINNTRREVYRHEAYVTLDPDNDQRMRLTEQGVSLAMLFVLIERAELDREILRVEVDSDSV